MQINIKFCVDVFKGLGYDVLTNKYGTFIKVPIIHGFRFSMICGAPFLNTSTGITLKGRNEVLIHRGVFQEDSLIYTPGLFGRDEEGFLQEGESFLALQKRYPEIFIGNFKYIYLESLTKNQSSNIECELFEKFSTQFLKDRTDYLNPNNIILLKIFDNGSNMEPFLEYMASAYFNKLGFVTENQVPWFQQKYRLKDRYINGGIPDFSVLTYSFLSDLANKGILYEGMPIQEFGLTFFKGLHRHSQKNYKYDLKIGEVKLSKSSRKQILKQLEQYDSAELANELFGVVPDEINKLDNFGLMNFINGLKYLAGKQSKVNNEIRKKDDEWLTIYTKLLLLSNIEFKRIIKYVNSQLGNTKNPTKIRSADLLEAVIKSKNKEFIDYLIDNI
jgi:hypothetical protein